VGFFLLQSIPYKVLQNLSPFIEKSFESLSLEVTLNTKKLILTNIYRPPNPIQNLSLSDHITSFIDTFDQLTADISYLNLPSVILSDSNLNLHQTSVNHLVELYNQSLCSNGFVQTILKSTRIHADSHSLIDHISTNIDFTSINTGVIVNDLSDHFINFLQLPFSKLPKTKTSSKPTCDFSLINYQRFETTLAQMSWNDVINKEDVNASFDTFWTTFKDLFDLHFPLTTRSFNRNIHKINPFMTSGLLTSRTTKNSLYLKSIAHPSATNVSAYKVYRNLYNTLIRKSRQIYYASSLHMFRNNPKRTWDILKEATTGKTFHKPISEIVTETGTITDPKFVAEEYNKFFSNIGSKIASTIIPSPTDPLSYIPNNPNVPTLNINLTGPSQIIDLLKSFDSKSTPDLDGISIKLLKFVSHEIAVPLAHIFNLSISLGVFPDKFKIARIVPVLKLVIRYYVTITVTDP
jgi:hypothetical protein